MKNGRLFLFTLIGFVLGAIVFGAVIPTFNDTEVANLDSNVEKPQIDARSTVEKLYDSSVLVGSIDECTYEGNKVYYLSINAFDAGSDFYDGQGNRIGICNYAWAQVDPICGNVENCVTVYMVEDNIWGQPAVDKYGLGE